MNNLKLFSGWVSHQRSQPKTHSFRYKIFQIWLDVEQPEAIDKVSRWWSSNRFNLVRFKRASFLPSELDLYQQIQLTIKQHTNMDFNGKAYLLASLDYWGYGYNPVTFICCYENSKLRFLISEVHNTPWGERFCYVHETNLDESNGSHQADCHEALFDKAFHVSPFMPMGLKYQWKYKVDEHNFFMKMNLYEDNRSIFNATLKLKGEQLTTKQANQIPFRYPLMCVKVLLAIYWQALKLWLKKIPFHSYPKENHK